MQSLTVIEKVAFFQQLSQDTKTLLSKIATKQCFQADEHLFLQNEPNPAVFFVLTGQIRVYRINPNGREQTLLIANAGDTINLPLAFSDHHQAHANAIALSESENIAISQADFYQATSSNNELAILVIKNLSKKIQGLVQLSHDLSLLSVRSRLAKFLLDEIQRDNHFEIQWTQEEIANQIGTVREIVSRNLRQFVKEDLIEFERHNIHIIDSKRLQTIAEE